eukprot:scaffold6448_cov124-Isochrysis_galbana.AAC.5
MISFYRGAPAWRKPTSAAAPPTGFLGVPHRRVARRRIGRGTIHNSRLHDAEATDLLRCHRFMGGAGRPAPAVPLLYTNSSVRPTNIEGRYSASLRNNSPTAASNARGMRAAAASSGAGSGVSGS